MHNPESPTIDGHCHHRVYAHHGFGKHTTLVFDLVRVTLYSDDDVRTIVLPRVILILLCVKEIEFLFGF